MRLPDIEHVLRAAKAATEETEFVVIGSQALVVRFPDAPRYLTYSQELDIYPLNAPEKSDLIDGSIGELSLFHETHGYYAHGVAPETAVLPLKWRERVVRFESENTGGAVASCLHPLDVAYSKLVAGRPKDTAFVGEMIRCNIVKAGSIEKLIDEETNDKRVDVENFRASLRLAKQKSLHPPE